MCSLLGNIYIKEFNVGHGARKHDHFVRAVFVSFVGEGGRLIINMERINSHLFTVHVKRQLSIVDLGG